MSVTRKGCFDFLYRLTDLGAEAKEQLIPDGFEDVLIVSFRTVKTAGRDKVAPGRDRRGGSPVGHGGMLGGGNNDQSRQSELLQQRVHGAAAADQNSPDRRHCGNGVPYPDEGHQEPQQKVVVMLYPTPPCSGRSDAPPGLQPARTDRDPGHAHAQQQPDCPFVPRGMRPARPAQQPEAVEAPEERGQGVHRPLAGPGRSPGLPLLRRCR